MLIRTLSRFDNAHVIRGCSTRQQPSATPLEHNPHVHTFPAQGR